MFDTNDFKIMVKNRRLMKTTLFKDLKSRKLSIQNKFVLTFKTKSNFQYDSFLSWVLEKFEIEHTSVPFMCNCFLKKKKTGF